MRLPEPLLKKFPERTLQESLLLLKRKEDPITWEDILASLSGKGLYLLIIMLVIPFCQPLQIPGFSTPFGLLIALLGLQMMFGKTMWLPHALRQKKIPHKILHKIIDASLLFLGKMKRWVHPRWLFITQNFATQVFNGLLITCLGLLLALPLPIPFSNLAIAWPILILALGLLEDDGLIVVISYILTAGGLILFILLLLGLKQLFL